MDNLTQEMDWSLLTALKNDITIRQGERLYFYKIKKFFIDQSFSVVYLNSGHLGFAMNYGIVSSGREAMRAAQQELTKYCDKDPLLLKTLWDFDTNIQPLLRSSLQAAVLSALSKPVLVTPTVNGFKRRAGHFSLDGVAESGDRVAVIGMGGFMLSALKSSKVKRIYLSDLFINNDDRRARIEGLRSEYPDKELITTNGSSNHEILCDSHIACITASALANGTLKNLLESAKKCRVVILQGISGHVYPQVLFEHGIHYIATSSYPADAWKQIYFWRNKNPNGNFSAFLDQSFPEKVLYYQ